MSYLSSLTASLRDDFDAEVESRREYGEKVLKSEQFRQHEGRKLLKETLKCCIWKGKNVAEMDDDDPELDKVMATLVEKTLEHAGMVSKAGYLVGGDLREKIADMSLDQAANSSDVLLAVQCPTYNEDGEHTTLVKTPRNELNGEFLLSVIHKFIQDIFSRSYDIKDPIDLHTMVYNALMLMGVAEAKVVARAYTKNIDTAALMENRDIAMLVEEADKEPFCNALKGKNFFTAKTPGNNHLKEIDDAREKERLIMERTNDGFGFEWPEG